MASEAEASCISDPNFAVICSFLERFAETCGIVHPDYKELQQMLENCEQVDTQLIDLHIKLLRKARKSFTTEKWEKALIKFCHINNQEDATQVETLGYLKVPLPNKIRILKTLLEAQFDVNVKFKAAINKLTASELRLSPLGRDSDGQLYWVQQDDHLNVRIYQEDQDEGSWKLVVKDRESLAQLITKLSGGKLGPAELDSAVLDDDSTQSQDDEDEETQPDDILLDTGQPEDAKPPGMVNGSHRKKKKKHHDKQLNENEEANCEKQDLAEDPPNPPETGNAAEDDNDLKRKAEPDDNETKKTKVEVGEAIEEPVMHVQGEGSGADCDAVFGEAIEEPVMFFCGVGSGVECDTGNPGEGKEEEKQPEKEAAQDGKSDDSPSKSAVWSIDQICGTSKPSQPSFSMGMMFGNLAKPSFVPSPEKPSFFNINFAANAKTAQPPMSNETAKTEVEKSSTSSEESQCEENNDAVVTSQAPEQSECKEEISDVNKDAQKPVSENVLNELTEDKSVKVKIAEEVTDPQTKVEEKATPDQSVMDTSDSVKKPESLKNSPEIPNQDSLEGGSSIEKPSIEDASKVKNDGVEEQSLPKIVPKVTSAADASSENKTPAQKSIEKVLPEVTSAADTRRETKAPAQKSTEKVLPEVTSAADTRRETKAPAQKSTEKVLPEVTSAADTRRENKAPAQKSIDKVLPEVTSAADTRRENKAPAQKSTEKVQLPSLAKRETKEELKSGDQVSVAAVSKLEGSEAKQIPLKERIEAVKESANIATVPPAGPSSASVESTHVPLTTSSEEEKMDVDEDVLVETAKERKGEPAESAPSLETKESASTDGGLLLEPMEEDESETLKTPNKDSGETKPAPMLEEVKEKLRSPEPMEEEVQEKVASPEPVKEIEEKKVELETPKSVSNDKKESKNAAQSQITKKSPVDKKAPLTKNEPTEPQESSIKVKEAAKESGTEVSLDKPLELDETKVEEVVKKEPLTVASALTFDYDPPASPEGKLVIETPPRVTRGRGRPARRKMHGNTVQSADRKTPDSTPVKAPSTPGRGRGRGRGGRGRPPGRPKAGRIENAESDESKDSASVETSKNKDDDGSPTKRVSRRIAVIRQKEEEERKIKEAEALAEMQRKRELELLRKAQGEQQSSSDSSSDSDSEASKSAEVRTKRKYTRRKKKDGEYEADAEELKMKKRKKKKRKRRRKGGNGNPWESSDSSDSSEESDGLEPEEEDDDDAVPELKSDHEFSPESDLELGPGEEHQPTKRARTATAKKEKSLKAKAEEEEEVDEYRCQKCQSGDRPETILLCDACDQGCHTTCLKPQLHLVPEEDWYCPPCGQNRLIEKLTSTLRELDRASRKKSNSELRKQRLAYVGISLSNIIPTKEEETEESDEQDGESVVSEAGSELKEALDAVEEDEENASSGSATTNSSESEEEKSEEDEEMYPLRQRRAAATVKYDFQEYDEMINSAIQDEVDLVKGAGNQGKGKDISTIVNAEDDEGADKPFEPAEEEEKEVEEKEKESESEQEEDDDDDDDDLNKAAAKRAARERERLEIIANANMNKKKQKKKSIACLDVSSGDDDHASDEDFVGSDSDFEDEEEDDASMDSGDSDVVRRRGKKGASGPVRRSNRARQSRYDKEFIDDSDGSDDGGKAKKKKGGRSKGWLGSDYSESEDSESDDSDWGGKKKKKRKAPPRQRAPAKRRKKGGKKKKSKAPARKRPPPKDSDSDKPVVKKPRPPKPERPKSPLVIEKRTTRGKKINYQEIVGSDSDEAKPSRVKAKKQHFASDEEDFKPEDEEASPSKVTPDRNGTAPASKAVTPVKGKASPSIQPSRPPQSEKPSVITKAPIVEDAEEPLIPTTLNPPEKLPSVPLEATTPASTLAGAYPANKFPFSGPPAQPPTTQPPPDYQGRPPPRYAPPASQQQLLAQGAFRGANMPMRPRLESKEVGLGRGQYQPPPAYQGPQQFFYGADEYYEGFPQEPATTTFETPTVPPQGSTGEDEVGEFGGLVSYFSSQREDDLES